jgi:lysophospholipase L1-like esterase
MKRAMQVSTDNAKASASQTPKVKERLSLLALCCALLVACSTEPADVAGTDPRIEWTGLALSPQAGVTSFSWPAVQFRVRFEGTSLRALIEDASYPDEDRQTDLLAVEVDGAPRGKVRLRAGLHEYTLVKGLEAGAHVLAVTKRTEPLVGTVSLHGLYAGGGTRILAPPPRRVRRIEAVGDSMMAGYGNETRDPGYDCQFDPREQDASRTFVAVAARMLDAELVLQAWSGKGIYRNYRVDDRVAMPQLYGQVLPGADNHGKIPARDPPQVMVFGLGTNDFIAGAPDRQRFIDTYRELIGKARSAAPDALVVIVLGPMLTEDYPAAGARSTARAWLVELRDVLVGAGVKAVLVEQAWVEGEPRGCGGHPGLLTHARFGSELAVVVREALGW